VFDGTRDINDPLSRVVVDINSKGFSLTDLNNTTGHIKEFGNNPQKYLDYLKSHNIDISQFKIDPFTEEEKKENEALHRRIINLKDFINLSYDYKMKYIARGYLLTNDQLKYMVDHNANELVDIYADQGTSIPPSQVQMLKPNQIKTYERKQDIVLQNLIQQNDRADLMYYACLNFNYKAIDYLLSKGVDANDIASELKESYLRSAATKDPELKECLIWLFHHKDGCHANMVIKNALQYSTDFLKYLVENAKGEGDQMFTAQLAVRRLDYTDIENIKWMVEKGADAEGALDRILTISIITNDFDLIKWFYEHDASPAFLILHTKSPEIWKWIINESGETNLCNTVMDAMHQNGNKDYNLFLWLVSKGGDINHRLYDWIGNKERNIDLIKHGASLRMMWGYCVQNLDYDPPKDTIEFFEWMLQNHNDKFYLNIGLKNARNFEITKTLLRHGADLKIAAEYARNVDEAKYLLSIGADIRDIGENDIDGCRIPIMKKLGYPDYSMKDYLREQG